MARLSTYASAPAPPSPISPTRPTPTLASSSVSPPSPLGRTLSRRTERMRCPRCTSWQDVGVAAVSHHCDGCRLVWWFAACRRCQAMHRVADDLESWKCPCGFWNRSWWRAAEGDRDREETSARVRARRVEESRLLPRLSRPALVGLVLALVAGIGLTLLRSSVAPSARGGATGATGACAAFREYRSRYLAGTPTSPDLVVQRASSASSDVRDAASRLQAASRAEDPDSLLAAVADLTTLCHP